MNRRSLLRLLSAIPFTGLLWFKTPPSDPMSRVAKIVITAHSGDIWRVEYRDENDKQVMASERRGPNLVSVMKAVGV